MSGLPPHIAQVIAGHQDINVTMSYKAVYPEEAIQAHLAFLARRRACGPPSEYRVPTDAGMARIPRPFRAAKGRHRNMRARLRDPLYPRAQLLALQHALAIPAQRHRIAEIRDNLIARIAEAEREGWLGEIEGLKISLAGANDKLAQIDRRARAAVNLGMPAIPASPQPRNPVRA